jgi:hypothetical protein
LEGGADLTRSVGGKLEQVAHFLAGRQNERRRNALAGRVEQWIHDAEVNNPEKLVLLWCALQWGYDEIVRRVQALLDRSGAATGTEKRGVLDEHPLVYILGARMLKRSIRGKIAGIDAGRWLGTDYDLLHMLHSEPDDYDKRTKIRNQWRTWLRGCFDIASDLPIPVIRADAKLPLPGSMRGRDIS